MSGAPTAPPRLSSPSEADQLSPAGFFFAAGFRLAAGFFARGLLRRRRLLAAAGFFAAAGSLSATGSSAATGSSLAAGSSRAPARSELGRRARRALGVGQLHRVRVRQLHLRQRVVQVARLLPGVLPLQHLQDRPDQLDGDAHVVQVAHRARLVREAELGVAEVDRGDDHVAADVDRVHALELLQHRLGPLLVRHHSPAIVRLAHLSSPCVAAVGATELRCAWATVPANTSRRLLPST